VRRLAPWAIIAVAALGYPLVTLANGAPRFPSREDCVRPAVAGSEIDAVFGRVDSEAEARRLQSRALAAGFEGTEYERDACGRVRVFVPGIPTLEVGRELAQEARGPGFDVTLERAG
jgi:hypothetical protein